jgi:ABC-2 type transport system permease protein
MTETLGRSGASRYSFGPARALQAEWTKVRTVAGAFWLLAAKAAVLTGLVLAAGVIAVAGSVLADRLILPGRGFTAARGFPPLSPGDGPVLRGAAGSVLYLALIALLSLGIATIIRDSAAAIGIVLGLLYLPPLITAALASNPQWQHRIERHSPMSAGLTIQDTTGLRNLPISPYGPASASSPSGPPPRCSPAG